MRSEQCSTHRTHPLVRTLVSCATDHDVSVCARFPRRCARCQKSCIKCLKACKDSSKKRRREGRELCLVVFVMIAIISGMLVFFATFMRK